MSAFLRQKIESISPRQFIGVNLASLTFFAAIVVPQTQAMVTSTDVLIKTQKTAVTIVPDTHSLQWPLLEVSISQKYSRIHPGLDLRAPVGSAIYPIADGMVSWTLSLPWGYGKHVFIKHTDHISALYAHMSNVEVKKGDAVFQNKEIGQVGSTGWSTGNHLHMEIYQDNIPINPIEVLPTIL